MTIGRNIRALRKRRGLTLEALSALCGVAGNDLGRYERGEITPRPATVQKIAQALDVPMEAIRRRNMLFWGRRTCGLWRRPLRPRSQPSLSI